MQSELRGAAQTAPTDTWREMFQLFISPSPQAGPLTSCGIPGRPAGCDRDGAPSAFKCVTELPPLPFLFFQEFPWRLLPALPWKQCASGASPKRICLSNVACSLRKEPQMEKTGGGMETEGRRQRQTGGSGDEMVFFPPLASEAAREERPKSVLARATRRVFRVQRSREVFHA